MSVRVSATHIQEIKALIETNDVDLDERKQVFRRITGRDTVLTDTGLIAAVAYTTDDDDELFVDNVKRIEREGFVQDTEETKQSA